MAFRRFVRALLLLLLLVALAFFVALALLLWRLRGGLLRRRQLGAPAALRARVLRVEVVRVAAVAAVVELAAARVGGVVVPARRVVLALADLGGQLAQVLGCGA